MYLLFSWQALVYLFTRVCDGPKLLLCVAGSLRFVEIKSIVCSFRVILIFTGEKVLIIASIVSYLLTICLSDSLCL